MPGGAWPAFPQPATPHVAKSQSFYLVAGFTSNFAVHGKPFRMALELEIAFKLFNVVPSAVGNQPSAANRCQERSADDLAQSRTARKLQEKPWFLYKLGVMCPACSWYWHLDSAMGNFHGTEKSHQPRKMSLQAEEVFNPSVTFLWEECLICIMGETARKEGYEKVIKLTSETGNYIQSTHEQELNFNSTCRFYRHLQSSIWVFLWQVAYYNKNNLPISLNTE